MTIDNTIFVFIFSWKHKRLLEGRLVLILPVYCIGQNDQGT